MAWSCSPGLSQSALLAHSVLSGRALRKTGSPSVSLAPPQISLKPEPGDGETQDREPDGMPRCDSAWDYPCGPCYACILGTRSSFPLYCYAHKLYRQKGKSTAVRGRAVVFCTSRPHLSNGAQPCSADASELHCITEFCCCR